MHDDKEPPIDEEFLKTLPVQSETIGFGPDELVSCTTCARANPPTRLRCVYCGAELPLTPEQAAAVAPQLRRLESFENGFNVIYRPSDDTKTEAANVAELAKFVGIEEEDLKNILESGKPLPLARTETAKEAEILGNRLRKDGFETCIVADEALAADDLPKRLRGLEFRGDDLLLILFNNDEVTQLPAADLSVIVTGAIFEKSVESMEKRKKGETKILETTETASDELLIDFYSKNDPAGYRILTKGFDFSCLGAEKGIIARDNLKRLVEKLHEAAPDARLVEDYTTIRGLLGGVWEVEQRRDSRGLTRQRFGKFDLSSVSSSSNRQQFTKYSRLQWRLWEVLSLES
ncbi:MAG: hypothetical protein JSS81_23105 [Acidobacteria bacterium]|nr:hypothetical protein [Acidobacteriota bacterium]